MYYYLLVLICVFLFYFICFCFCCCFVCCSFPLDHAGNVAETFDVLMSEEILKIGFLTAKTFAKVTRCAFFSKGCNNINFKTGKCDMDKVRFLLIWADNESFAEEIEAKFIATHKCDPEITISINKSLLSDEAPTFDYDFQGWINIPELCNTTDTHKIQIADILFMLGIGMINNENLFKLLPPFDTIKSLIVNLDNGINFRHDRLWDLEKKNCYGYHDGVETYSESDLSQTEKDFFNDCARKLAYDECTDGGFCPFDNQLLVLLVSGFIRNSMYDIMLDNDNNNDNNYGCYKGKGQNFGLIMNQFGEIVYNCLKSMFYVLSNDNPTVFFDDYNNVVCNFTIEKEDRSQCHDEYSLMIFTPSISQLLTMTTKTKTQTKTKNDMQINSCKFKKDSVKLQVKVKEFECLNRKLNNHDFYRIDDNANNGDENNDDNGDNSDNDDSDDDDINNNTSDNYNNDECKTQNSSINSNNNNNNNNNSNSTNIDINCVIDGMMNNREEDDDDNSGVKMECGIIMIAKEKLNDDEKDNYCEKKLDIIKKLQDLVDQDSIQLSDLKKNDDIRIKGVEIEARLENSIFKVFDNFNNTHTCTDKDVCIEYYHCQDTYVHENDIITIEISSNDCDDIYINCSYFWSIDGTTTSIPMSTLQPCFDYFDCYFALSCEKCVCHTGSHVLRSGFQFQVSIE